MRKKIALMILAGVFALAGAALVQAQEQPPQQPGPPSQQPQPPDHPRDPLGDSMFPPELIMQHQRELALTDEQKSFMRGEINKTSSRFNELQWQLEDSMEALGATMKGDTVDEQVALAELDKVLENERQIKRLHMELAIRLKNKLTPEQQLKLRGMRRGPGMNDGPERGPGRGPGMGPGRRPGGPGPGPGGLGRPNGPRPGGPGGPGGGPGDPPRP